MGSHLGSGSRDASGVLSTSSEVADVEESTTADVGDGGADAGRAPSAGSAEASSATDQSEPVLSVVIVTYNEAERVDTCIESVLECCRDGPPFEVILVDSNSTDDTVDVATEYPVSILRIPEDDLTTPAAGRFVGTEAARGDYLLFVDGDMQLTSGWLPDALDALRAAPDVAGVDGHLNESGSDDVTDADLLHGVALYDADVLASITGFDPYLRSLEDADLSYRLLEADYRILRLPAVVANHPYSPGASEVRRRWRNGYYFGRGQLVRRSLSSPGLLYRSLRGYRHPLCFQAWMLAGLATLFVGSAALIAWLVCSAGLFAANVAVEGRERATQRSLDYAVRTIGLLRGLAMRNRDPATFPVETVEAIVPRRRVHADAVEPAADGPSSTSPQTGTMEPPAQPEVEST